MFLKKEKNEMKTHFYYTSLLWVTLIIMIGICYENPINSCPVQPLPHSIPEGI